MASDANARTLSGFLDYLRVERGLAKLTIAAYTSDLMQFTEFLEKRQVVLSKVRRDDVREYLQELFSNSLDGRSWEENSPQFVSYIGISCSMKRSTRIPR